MTRLRACLATTLVLVIVGACGDEAPGPPAQSDTTTLAGDSPSLPGDCDELPDAETLRRLTRAAPDCRNTWRNGEKIGDAAPVPPYPHDR